MQYRWAGRGRPAHLTANCRAGQGLAEAARVGSSQLARGSTPADLRVPSPQQQQREHRRPGGPHSPLTSLLVGNVHLAAAQRGGHLGGGQRAVAVLVKLIKDVAERVGVGARGDALAGQQLQGGRGRG